MVSGPSFVSALRLLQACMQSRRRNKKTHFNVTSELFVRRGSEPPLHTLPPLPPSEDIPPPQSYAPTFQGDSGKLERYVLHFFIFCGATLSHLFLYPCLSFNRAPPEIFSLQAVTTCRYERWSFRRFISVTVVGKAITIMLAVFTR